MNEDKKEDTRLPQPGRAIIDIFILILFMVAIWYLQEAFGTGIPLIEHIAIAIWIICISSIFVLVAIAILTMFQKD